MRLINENTGRIIASEVELAEGFWRRFRGLMLRRRLQRGRALLFKFRRPGRSGVHMFFMRFPIDLLYLDPKFMVVETRPRLKPWRMHWPKVASMYIIELPAGTIARARVEVGHKISIEK